MLPTDQEGMWVLLLSTGCVGVLATFVGGQAVHEMVQPSIADHDLAVAGVVGQVHHQSR